MSIAPRIFYLGRNRYNFQTTTFAERRRKPAEDAEALRDGMRATAVAADVIDALDFTVAKSASNQELVKDDFPDYRAAYNKVYLSDWDVYLDPVAKLDDNGVSNTIISKDDKNSGDSHTRNEALSEKTFRME